MSNWQLKLVSFSTSLSGHKQLGVVVPWQLLAAAKVYAAHRCTGDHFLRICWEARCEIDEIETWLSFLVYSSMSQGTPLEQKASQHEIVRRNSSVFGTLIRKIFFIHYTLEGSGRIRSWNDQTRENSTPGVIGLSPVAGVWTDTLPLTQHNGFVAKATRTCQIFCFCALTFGRLRSRQLCGRWVSSWGFFFFPNTFRRWILPFTCHKSCIADFLPLQGPVMSYLGRIIFWVLQQLSEWVAWS